VNFYKEALNRPRSTGVFDWGEVKKVELQCAKEKGVPRAILDGAGPNLGDSL
jgi:hypothetical protein